MANPLVCVDLSHHNPEPDWAKLKAGGVQGVILKATEGKTYIDPTFVARRAAAMRAGLKVSSYHFLRPGSMDQQMSHYLDVVTPVTGERVVIDHEDAGVSVDALCDAVEALIRRPIDLQVTIYSGHLIKEQLGTAREQLLADFTSLWIAQYTSAASPSWPKGTWPVWSLWQFTDKAKVTGIGAPVDGNRFNGPTENFINWMGPKTAPEPVPGSPTVTLDITVPEGVTLDITVNGEMMR